MTSTQEPWWADRDEEDHRPPAARGRGSRRTFGQSWWGGQWVSALEDRAALDPGRLSRGRSYARRGAVDRLTLAPGLVMASVQGSRALPYTVTVRVTTFDKDEWTRVLDAIATQIGRVAALLDGELPPEVVDDVGGTGLGLLPGPGEIQPRCSCPDVGDPCKHAAAVCYLIADAMDEDPFAVLLLRGRPRGEVLSALRARRASATPGSGRTSDDDAAATVRSGRAGDLAEVAGVVARDAYARSGDPRPAVPVPPLPPDRPSQPVTVAVDPPPGSGIDPEALRLLAAAAAERAWRLATADPPGPQSP
ncbi:SWIM zinc finger family protein [Actinopolymorpha sp. B17G11]|uniref:SWIM zinc finger family protein n=1 Tax=Actinopolymorpha sp. B17G11 TaxID=3160861 RepID=UPI0032E36A72